MDLAENRLYYHGAGGAALCQPHLPTPIFSDGHRFGSSQRGEIPLKIMDINIWSQRTAKLIFTLKYLMRQCYPGRADEETEIRSLRNVQGHTRSRRPNRLCLDSQRWSKVEVECFPDVWWTGLWQATLMWTVIWGKFPQEWWHLGRFPALGRQCSWEQLE